MDPVEIIEAARTAVKADLLDEAVVLLDALGDLPSARLWLLRADLHRERCEPELALRALKRACELGAGDEARVRAALMWSPIMGDPVQLAVEWRRCSDALANLAQEYLEIPDPVGALPWLDFYLAYRGRSDRTQREHLAATLRRASPILTFEAPHVAGGARPDGPVRLGICSAHLKDHTIGRLNEALVRRLGSYGFTVVLCVPELADDPLASAMAAGAGEVLVLGRDLVDARARLSAARLDILHYPDLGMDPFTTWLAFARLAPVQTVSWGHPITSGLDTIDAFLASPALTPPGSQEDFTERLVQLPDPMVCWTPPEPPAERPRAQLGLPEGRRTYVVPQSAFKLHPDFDVALRRIAEADPDGVIALLAPKRETWKQRLQARIGLPSHQLVWLPGQPREGFLALLAQADVILDPFPFGGGHTSLEALAVGTPIATLPTGQLRGRLTAAWYRTMGLAAFVAPDLAAYVDLAVGWANDPSARARASAAIRARSDRLFRRSDAVAAHAAVFHQLVSEASREQVVQPMRRSA